MEAPALTALTVIRACAFPVIPPATAKQVTFYGLERTFNFTWSSSIEQAATESATLEPTTANATTEGPTTAGPTTQEPTTPGPTTQEPTTTGVPSSSTATEIPYCSSKCLCCFSFLRPEVFSLDISIIPVDYDTRLTVLSASVSVFVVNAESVYPLITGVTVDSSLGVAAVRIPFEASLLLLVQASGYSTASRSYNSYCSSGRGSKNRCKFLYKVLRL